jgi:transposase-like protein
MNNEPEPKVRKKRYDLNFKRSAVKLWLGSGKSAAQVAAPFRQPGFVIPGN